MCTTGRGVGGASKRVGAMGSLGAKRTVGGGWRIGWDGLYVHVGAGAASKGGQAECTLRALSRQRGLWEEGRDSVGMP